MKTFKRGYTTPIPKDAKRFKRKNIWYVRFVCKGQTIEAKLTQDGNRVLRESEKWYIEFEDNLQRPQSIKAFSNEQASRQLADKIQQLMNYRAVNTPLGADLLRFVEQLPSKIRDELISFGIIDSPKAKRSMAIVSLLAEYEEWLRTSKHTHTFKRTKQHTDVACSRIRSIAKNCNFVVWDDIKAAPIEQYLGDKAISPGTYNGYVFMWKSFCSWVVDNGYVDKSPVRGKRLKPLSDSKKTDKIAFTTDEVTRLIDAAENGPDHHSTSGHDRAVAYLFGAETGLRIGTITKLTIADFDLDNCLVRIPPEINKTRKEHTVYLRPGRAEQLAEHFKGRIGAARAFRIGNQGVRRAAEMVKADLRYTAVRDTSGAVTVPAIPFKDKDGKKRCFHSLRRTANTEVQRITKDTILTKMIMGHTIPKEDMTAHYNDVKPEQLRAIIEQMPVYQWPSKEAMAATGTDGKADDTVLAKSCGNLKICANPNGTGEDSKGLQGQKNVEQASLQGYNKAEQESMLILF